MTDQVTPGNTPSAQGGSSTIVGSAAPKIRRKAGGAKWRKRVKLAGTGPSTQRRTPPSRENHQLTRWKTTRKKFAPAFEVNAVRLPGACAPVLQYEAEVKDTQVGSGAPALDMDAIEYQEDFGEIQVQARKHSLIPEGENYDPEHGELQEKAKPAKPEKSSAGIIMVVLLTALLALAGYLVWEQTRCIPGGPRACGKCEACREFVKMIDSQSHRGSYCRTPKPSCGNCKRCSIFQETDVDHLNPKKVESKVKGGSSRLKKAAVATAAVGAVGAAGYYAYASGALNGALGGAGASGNAPKPNNSTYVPDRIKKYMPDSVKNTAGRVDKALDNALARASVGWTKYLMLGAALGIPTLGYMAWKYVFPDRCKKCNTALSGGLCPKCQKHQKQQLDALQRQIDSLVRDQKTLEQNKKAEIAKAKAAVAANGCQAAKKRLAEVEHRYLKQLEELKQKKEKVQQGKKRLLVLMGPNGPMLLRIST